MADVDFDDYDGGAPASVQRRFQHIFNLAGAATSVALVIGLAVWGYQLAVRDVTGIPVVRAVEGPMRIAPTDPGGEIADHQGLAVNDVAAAGVATAPAERLVLAPAPVALTLEDNPGLSALAPLEETTDIAAPSVPAVTEDQAIAATDAAEADAVTAALAEALAEGAAPLSPLADPAPDATQLSALAAEAVLPEETALVAAPEGALTRSLRPAPRPASRPASAPATGEDPAATDSTAVAVTPEAEIDPATLAVGTRLVQLGAFDTADQARGEWTKLQTRFGELMGGKAIVIQEAESGGRTFFRLRAHGFEGEDDARRFCSALLSENAACIPVSHR